MHNVPAGELQICGADKTTRTVRKGEVDCGEAMRPCRPGTSCAERKAVKLEEGGWKLRFKAIDILPHYGKYHPHTVRMVPAFAHATVHIHR